MGQWEKTVKEGYKAWVGQTSLISICVIPELGSKVISLVNRKTNREWIWRSGKPLGNQGYDSSFVASDESGWDEMFPGINICVYPNVPWEGKRVPDHGEVWSLPWQDLCTDTGMAELHCVVNGVNFPYSLAKVYSFPTEETVRIDYTLTNKSDFPFSFLWAAHPLFQVHEGMKLHVPSELTEIEVSYSEGNRLGVFQDKWPWPLVLTGEDIIDLSTIEPESAKSAEKYYFTGKLTTGIAGLSDPVTGEGLTFAFPPEQVPYLAIWANFGGFEGNYHLAIEPATGRMDDLAHAIRTNEVAIVEASGTYKWHIEISIR